MLFGYGGMNTERRRSGGSDRNGRKQGGRKTRSNGGIRVRTIPVRTLRASRLPSSLFPVRNAFPSDPTSATPLLCVKIRYPNGIGASAAGAEVGLYALRTS